MFILVCSVAFLATSAAGKPSSAPFFITLSYKISAAHLAPPKPFAPALKVYCIGLPTVHFSVVATTSSIRLGINKVCLAASLATFLAPWAACPLKLFGAFCAASLAPVLPNVLARVAAPPVAATSSPITPASTGKPINPLWVISMPIMFLVSANQGLISFCTFCIMSYFSAIDGSLPIFWSRKFWYSASTLAPISVSLEGSIQSAKGLVVPTIPVGFAISLSASLPICPNPPRKPCSLNASFVSI